MFFEFTLELTCLLCLHWNLHAYCVHTAADCAYIASYTSDVRSRCDVRRTNSQGMRSLVSSAGIATAYRLDARGVDNFHFSLPFGLRPTTRPIQWARGGLYPQLKATRERIADHSPQTSAEAKKTWIYTSTPPYVFME
jgi:hypothetical protein